MTFSKYLGHRLKYTALRSIVATLISVATVLYTVLKSNEHPGNYYRSKTGLDTIPIIIGFFATVIPVLETAYFKRRRNLDTLYSLPMSRAKLALAHYLSGFIQVTFICAVSFIAAYLYISFAFNYDYYDMRPAPLYFLCCLLFGLAIYSVSIFIFSEANTSLDGVILSHLWMYALWVLMSALMSVSLDFDFYTKIGMTYNDYSRFPPNGNIYHPLEHITLYFRPLIEIRRSCPEYYPIQALTGYILWGTAGAAATFGYFRNMMRKSANSAGEISNSLFGYKLLIPLYGYSLMLICSPYVIRIIFIFAAMIIGYFIFRRRFIFKISDYIMLAIGLILAIAVC